MPQYLYSNPSNPEEIVEVFQHMKDVHQHFVDGVEWRRVWTVPQACIDSSSAIDPFSSRDFVEKTGKKKGSYGDLMEAAKIAHEQRVEKRGFDEVKNKFLENYKKTNGTEHFSVGKTNKITKNGITVDLAAK